MYLIIGLALIVIAYFIHRHIIKPQNFWKNRNIPYFCALGPYEEIISLLLKKYDMYEIFNRIYQAYPDKKFYGTFGFRIPQLMIRDPELIRDIVIKDFDHFTDHFNFIPIDNDDVFSRNLFALKGKRWHSMRTTLSPSFTGSKMRGIFQLMADCGDQIVEYYNNQFKTSTNNILEIEFKESATRFTNDIIASIAFGIKCNSLKDPNNEFYKMGRNVTQLSFLRILLLQNLPFVARFFGIKLMPQSVYNFFNSIIGETVRVRQEQNIVRPDMINLLLEAQKEQQKKAESDSSVKVLELIDMVAQAFIFFFAGFETVAVAMSFASYEMACNPECQKKLQEEIDTTLKQCDNNHINYETLQKMKYLDAVVSETLRKWPPAVQTDRICTKKYTLKCDNNEQFEIEKDWIATIPIYGIHRDEKYYPNPSKFDPERFMDGNIDQFTYMPFGLGPRQCIANRFALLEVKVFLFFMLAHFNFEVIKRTPIPMVIKPGATNLTAKDGFWIGLKSRK